MKVTTNNTREWQEFVETDKDLISHISRNIEINEKYYSQKPYSLDEGYGFEIHIFKQADEFVNFLIDKNLLNSVAEYMENVESKNDKWLCLTYLISSDNGIVIYYKMKI